MKIRKPNYFNEFKCIASECEDTCCAGWGIAIDDATHKKYLAVDGKFGDRLRNEIMTEEDDNIFKLKGDNCTFLNENKLCDIYTELGAEALCYTCREYPRYIEDFSNLREIGISLSCPEAARIILESSEKVEFELIENNEDINILDDINPIIYANLMECRDIVFDILQNRNLDLKVRCALILVFADEIQEKIDSSNIEDIEKVKNKYLDQSFIEESIESIEEYRGRESEKYNNINEVFGVFEGLRHINPNDPLGLEDALRYFWQSEDDEIIYLNIHKKFEEYYKYESYKFEQILVYFVFKHFMKAVFDYDVLAKVKTALVSCLMIKELAAVRYLENREFTEEDMVDIAHTYSKDVEHLEENLETLAEVFETNEVFSMEEMIVTLMN